MDSGTTKLYKKKQEAIRLRKEGVPVQEITRILNISDTSVHDFSDHVIDFGLVEKDKHKKK